MPLSLTECAPQKSQSPPKGAGKLVPRENCRKVSTIFLRLFDDFWLFFPCAKNLSRSVKKYFWHFLTIFDVFWRGPFPLAPFAVRWRRSGKCHGLSWYFSQLLQTRVGATLLTSRTTFKGATPDAQDCFQRPFVQRPLVSLFPIFSTGLRAKTVGETTVRAEIITELMLERVGPIFFKTFLLKLIAFRPIPVIFPARGAKPENYWKR